MHQKAVPCLAQTKEYCKMFHLIDKGNRNEAKYDMAGKSQSHNWAPKLVFRLFNMAMNNAYIVYKDLVEREGGKSLLMGKTVKELAHSLCQQGASLQTRGATHPAHLHELDRIDGHFSGKKIWTDRKLMVMTSPPKGTVAILQRSQLMNQQKRHLWLIHQCMPVKVQGKCCWARCPGINNSKAKRKCAYDTNYMCEECTATMGSNMYLCHSVKNNKVVSCHVAYHKCIHNKVFLLDKCIGDAER
jgi:hypothetical protein